MKLRKLISLLLAAVMLLGAVAFAEPAKIVATDYTGKTIILHTNDVHGAIDGYAYIPTLREYFYSFGAEDVIVVDLHVNEVLDTTTGLSAGDILNYQLDVFRKTLEENKQKKGQKIVFIHGKGEGVLRHALINELKYKYKKYTYQDASFQEYGYGATQVTIR